MKNIIANNFKGFDEYRAKLMGHYSPPENETIVNGIISAAMSGQRL